LLDGWSWPLLLGEVKEVYRALRQGGRPRLTPARPCRTYIDWLQSQSLNRAESFWREQLAGFRSPTPLPAVSGNARPATPFVNEKERMTGGQVAALRTLAKKIRVTPGTLVEGAWALLLALWSGEDDVVFGAAFRS
jgi:Condensation domain